MKKKLIALTLISSIFMSGCGVMNDMLGYLDVFEEVDTFNDPKLIQREENVEKDREKLDEKLVQALKKDEFRTAESIIDSNLSNYTEDEINQIWGNFFLELFDDYYKNYEEYSRLIDYLRDNKATMNNYEQAITSSRDAGLIAIYRRMTDSNHIIIPGEHESYIGEHYYENYIVPDFDYYSEKYKDTMPEKFHHEMQMYKASFSPIFDNVEEKFILSRVVDTIILFDSYYHKYPNETNSYHRMSLEFEIMLGFSAYKDIADNIENKVFDYTEPEFARLVENVSNEELRTLLKEAWSIIERENHVLNVNTMRLYDIHEEIMNIKP